MVITIDNGANISFSGEVNGNDKRNGIFYLPRALKNQFSIINSCGVALLKENRNSGSKGKVWFLLQK